MYLIAPFAAQIFVILIILFFGLHLWEIDLGVPFNYWGDTVWFTVPIKGMIDNGWTYIIPQLSAPFTLSAAAFPSMTHTDWSVMKLISLFNNDAGRVLNFFWFFTIFFTALTAMIALNILGVRIWLAAVGGLIYSLLPFALLRNVSHITLVYYCVPVLSLLSIWIAQGCSEKFSKLIRFVGYFSAVAQGFNYIYYSFFAVLILAFAAWYGSVRTRSWRPIKESLIAVTIIIVTASINLTPSFISWHNEGKPPDMEYKSSVEAEIYALKIRKMLAPNEANKVPIFSQWAQRDKSTSFPNENENVSARLGPLASAGLVLIFMVILGLVSLRDEPESENIRPIVAITLFIILFATVGGFGAIFNLVFFEFRAYNRISVFIAFFALAAIILWWQIVYRYSTSNHRKIFIIPGLVLLTIFSLYDQILDFSHLRNVRSDQEVQARQLQALVSKVEMLVPPGSTVFQLPITGFPPDGRKERMLPYDHGRAYLASTSLHWSWPSFSRQHRAWQDQLIGLTASQLVEALALSKFRLVWIDRFGYGDSGQQIVTSLITAGAKELLPEVHSRYVILDLQNISRLLEDNLGSEKFESHQREYLNAPLFSWGTGFYTLEHNAEGRQFHWSQATSELVIRNLSNSRRSFEFSSFVAAGKPGMVTITIGGAKFSKMVSGVPTVMNMHIEFQPGEAKVLKYTSDMGRIDMPPNENRDLHFYVMDVKLRPVPS